MAENTETKKVETLQEVADIIMDMNIRLEKRYLDLTDIILAFTRNLKRDIRTANKRISDLEKDMKIVKAKLNIE
jgi:hypothetical protein